MGFINPLFPDGGDDQDKNSYILPNKQRRIEPIGRDRNPPSAVVELIRNKIDTLYTSEPDIKEELAHPNAAAKPLSKHQQFMHDLSMSGKSLAHIQTEWHNYYTHLPDHEKHEVWQEFYHANERATSNYAEFIAKHAGSKRPAARPPQPMPHAAHAAAKRHQAEAFVGVFANQPAAQTAVQSGSKRRSAAEIKKHILNKIRARSRAQTKTKKHFQSLVFGLGLGSLAVVIFLFGLFNERFITPFIQPSGRVGATPIILSTDGVAPSSASELIIPKINVQLPVVYGLPASDEATVQKALEEGIIHYPSTAVPGQQGNAAFFGHSSNNIFNKGRYKFAFVLLHELVPGDIFYMTHNGRVYTYRVYEKRVVAPTDTWVLGAAEGKTATAALITCDPPGTSTNRLVVWGEQITPDPNANAIAPTPTETAPTELASEGPTLWTRFWRWITPW